MTRSSTQMTKRNFYRQKQHHTIDKLLTLTLMNNLNLFLFKLIIIALEWLRNYIEIEIIQSILKWKV